MQAFRPMGAHNLWAVHSGLAQLMYGRACLFLQYKASEHAHLHGKMVQTGLRLNVPYWLKVLKSARARPMGLNLLLASLRHRTTLLCLHALPGCEHHSQPRMWRDSREH